MSKFIDSNGLIYLWTKIKNVFVPKEDGKGLSANDLTNDLKANYDAAYTHSQTDHAPADAEKNTVVGVQKNGVDVVVDAATRKANIEVPTKTSELSNDSGFITSSDIPEGAAASTTVPKMAGVAAVGTEMAFARGDHIHPSDTTKVDKEEGKGLSTNDYTTTEKEKLAGVEDGANNYAHPVHTAKTSGLYKVTVDAEGHVSAASEVAKEDITGLGIPAQDTTYTEATSTASGLMSGVDKAKLDAFDGADTYAKKTAIPTDNSQLANGAGYQTASDVAAAIAGAEHLKREKVTVLPDAASADEHTIYMVSKEGSNGDVFNEYMLIDGAFELIGNSEVDLTGYLKDEDMVAITNAEIDTICV